MNRSKKCRKTKDVIKTEGMVYPSGGARDAIYVSALAVTGIETA